MVLFRLTFPQSSCADVLVPGSTTGKMKRARRREISRNRREEKRSTKLRLGSSRSDKENDEGGDESENAGDELREEREEARKVSLLGLQPFSLPAESRVVRAIPVWDTCRRTCCIVWKTLKYIRGKKQKHQSERWSRRFLSQMRKISRVARAPFNRFFKKVATYLSNICLEIM